MLDTIIENLPIIITLALSVTLLWSRISKALVVVKETQELLTAIIIAFADQKITREELDTIVKEAKDIPTAIKDLITFASTVNK